MAVALAARAALRVLPVVRTARDEDFIEKHVLPAFRAAAAAWAAANYLAHETELVAAARAAAPARAASIAAAATVIVAAAAILAPFTFYAIASLEDAGLRFPVPLVLFAAFAAFGAAAAFAVHAFAAADAADAAGVPAASAAAAARAASAATAAVGGADARTAGNRAIGFATVFAVLASLAYPSYSVFFRVFFAPFHSLLGFFATVLACLTAAFAALAALAIGAERAFSAAYSARAVFGALAAATAAATARSAEFFWSALSADATRLEEGATPSAIAGSPLWPQGQPGELLSLWQELEAVLLAAKQDWQVWTIWYGDRLDGRVRDEERELAYVRIEEALWDQGPAAVNAEINRRVEGG